MAPTEVVFCCCWQWQMLWSCVWKKQWRSSLKLRKYNTSGINLNIGGIYNQPYKLVCILCNNAIWMYTVVCNVTHKQVYTYRSADWGAPDVDGLCIGKETECVIDCSIQLQLYMHWNTWRPCLYVRGHLSEMHFPPAEILVGSNSRKTLQLLTSFPIVQLLAFSVNKEVCQKLLCQ